MILCITALVLNLLALAGGITNLIYPTQYLYWNLYGYVMLLALLCNIVLAYLGGRYRYLDYSYLLLHIVSMLLIPLMNTLASSDVQNMTSQSILVLILYNVIFLFGTTNAGIKIKYTHSSSGTEPEIEEQERSGKCRNVIRWVMIIFLCLCLLFGIFLSYILLWRSTGNMIEVFVPVYSVYWGLLMLGASALVCRLRWRHKGSIMNKTVLIAGIAIFAVCMVPLASTPFMISNADTAYREAFGGALLDDRTVSERFGFKRKPFSLQDYFLGTLTRDYHVIEDVLYYEGTSGADAGIRLHFDVYMPLVDSNGLSDRNPVLIRIHGGAWVIGGKGAMNYAGTNKHFVNLGYVVFDIQYGLSDRSTSYPSAAVPAGVAGDFDIDDMIRHIGIFTTFMADSADNTVRIWTPSLYPGHRQGVS